MAARHRSSLPLFVLLSLVFAVSTGCPTTPDPDGPKGPELGEYGANEGSGDTPPTVNNLQPGGGKK